LAGIDHFGFLSSFYEKVIPLRNRDEIIHFSGLPISGALLDAGGGTGRVSKSLKGLASELILLDLSIPMLLQANSYDYIKMVNAHTEAFPFPDGYFERIIMIDALHHVCSQSETVYEMLRVLKPGGKIIIQEPDYNRFAVKLVALAEKIALMQSRFLTPDQIAALFDGNHRVKVKIERKEFNAWVIAEKLAY
jgi:ubiquinone/menaquinone biosynthesis C-methylase UbiE